MKHKILKKQNNTKMCMVCGMKNGFGLKASFYELDNDEIVAIFKPMEEHQGYPNTLHGGIAGAILDETIGRAMLIKNGDIWGVTIDLNLKYKKPIPLDEELRIKGRITKDSRRFFEGSGEIILQNGDVAVIGQGKYIKMPLDKIADFDMEELEWKIVTNGDDPDEIEI